MKKLAFALTVAAAAIGQSSAYADLLYQQFNPSTSTVGVMQDSSHEHADDFSVLNNSLANFVKWQGGYLNTAPPGNSNPLNHITETFTVNLYANAGDLPSALPLQTITGVATGDGGPLTALSGDGRRFYDYGLALPNWALTASVTYWISIYSNDSPNNWAWTQSNDGSADGAVRLGGPWLQQDGPPQPQANHVFFLTGTPVPAPDTVALLGLGLLGVATLRRYAPVRSR